MLNIPNHHPHHTKSPFKLILPLASANGKRRLNGPLTMVTYQERHNISMKRHRALVNYHQYPLVRGLFKLLLPLASANGKRHLNGSQTIGDC